MPTFRARGTVPPIELAGPSRSSSRAGAEERRAAAHGLPTEITGIPYGIGRRAPGDGRRGARVLGDRRGAQRDRRPGVLAPVAAVAVRARAPGRPVSHASRGRLEYPAHGDDLAHARRYGARRRRVLAGTRPRFLRVPARGAAHPADPVRADARNDRRDRAGNHGLARRRDRATRARRDRVLGAQPAGVVRRRRPSDPHGDGARAGGEALRGRADADADLQEHERRRSARREGDGDSRSVEAVEGRADDGVRERGARRRSRRVLGGRYATHRGPATGGARDRSAHRRSARATRRVSRKARRSPIATSRARINRRSKR